MAKTTNANSREHVPYYDVIDQDSFKLPEDNDPVMSDGAAAFEKPITDQRIHTALNLPQGCLFQKAKVLGQTKDDNGDIAG